MSVASSRARSVSVSSLRVLIWVEAAAQVAVPLVAVMTLT